MKAYLKATWISVACLCFMMIFPSLINADELSTDDYLKLNSTYEGFMSNDDILSYEELLSLSGTNVETEYDSLSQMKDMSPLQLSSMGVSEPEIDMIKNNSVKRMILDNAYKQSIDVLQKKGLSEEAIQNIKRKNYKDVSESEVALAASKLAFNIASVSRAGNACNYNIYWHWDIKPVITYTDTIASCVSDGYWMTSKCTALLTYHSDWEADTTDRIPPTYIGGDGCAFDIEMDLATPNGPKYCQAGKAFVSTLGNYAPDEVLAIAAYFHAWTPAGLDISVGGGNVSFSGNGSEECRRTYYIPK